MDTSPEIFGQRLKAIREEKGISLAQLGRANRIPVRNLEALEYGDDRHLPAVVYVKGYIKLYAHEFGLNADELIEDYIDAYLIEPSELTLSISTVDQPRSYTSLIVVLVFVAAMVLMVGSYYYLFRIKSTSTVTAQAPPAPAETATKDLPAKKPAVEKPDKLSVEMDASQKEPESEQTDENVAAEEESQSMKEETTGDAGVEEETTPEDEANAETESSSEPVVEPVVHELRVEALEETWLRVIIDDVKTRQRLLKKGDSASWEGKKFFKLRVGNAGGLNVYLDGVKQPQLGDRGLVLEKTFDLTDATD